MMGSGKGRVLANVVAAALCAVFGHGLAAAEGLTAVKLDSHARRVWDVAISPDGSHVASIGDEKDLEHRNGSTSSQSVLRIWETGQRKLIAATPLDNYQLLAVTFLPRGDRLVVGGWDGLYVVQARDGKLLHSFRGAKKPVVAVAVSRDGSLVASAALDAVQVWNVNTGEQLKMGAHGFGIKDSITLTRDGRLLFAGSAKSPTAVERTYFVRLWDIGQEARDLRFGFPAPMAHYRNVALSSDERRVFTLGPSDKIQEWDVLSGRLIREWEEHRGARLMAVSGHGRALATVNHEGQVTLWDAATAKPVSVCQIPTRSCQSVAVSDNGQHAIAGTDENDLWLISRTETIATTNAAAPRSATESSSRRAPVGLFPINPLPR